MQKRLITKIYPKLPAWKRLSITKILTTILTILFSTVASYSQNPTNTLLTISNSPSASTFRKAGDVIDYNILIKNTGNIPVLNMNVSDPNAVINTSLPIGSVLPGEAFAVSASHTITQADLDAGKLVNVVKVSGFDLDGNPIEKSGNKVFILGLQHPELNTTAATSVQNYRNEGEVIVYTVAVKNIGNITMNNIEVTDANGKLDFSGSINTLAPGAIDSVKAEYRISIDDINAGKVINAGIAQAFNWNNQLFIYRSNEVTVRSAIENFNLSNFPNPFYAETTIVFDLPEKGRAFLTIYDVSGKVVGHIARQEFNEGRNYVNWKSDNTQKGLYFLKINFNASQASRIISIVD